MHNKKGNYSCILITRTKELRINRELQLIYLYILNYLNYLCCSSSSFDSDVFFSFHMFFCKLFPLSFAFWINHQLVLRTVQVCLSICVFHVLVLYLHYIFFLFAFTYSFSCFSLSFNCLSLSLWIFFLISFAISSEIYPLMFRFHFSVKAVLPHKKISYPLLFLFLVDSLVCCFLLYTSTGINIQFGLLTPWMSSPYWILL